MLATFLAAGASLAQPAVEGPAPNGWEISFRSGALFPVGDAAEDAKLSEIFGPQFPLWLDLGYRFDKIFVGAYGQYAFGLLGSQLNCDGPSVGCSASAVRVGFEVQLHPRGRVDVDPWFGLGFGYQWTSLHSTDGSTSGTATVEGWDFGRLEMGVDFALGNVVRVGPFVGASLGQYSKSSLSTSSGQDRSDSIDRKALHSWISVGLKVTGLL